ncbi:hypothetical protein GCM10011375_37040 [Hymenobacter qilianensis]|uniref:Uncharacterized protein n=2 Tax=Hymenobacter qilianensis TaxID=1385715 RepID=A0ACB5PWK2_9BACT|nr:DUF885 domain-containing protein [Hymenobacter qilianensis]QNP51081.1 DUF885 domain-containing protein [Hymenobacter qilianensis]GGF78537.1 hypothetical protein GCM10011375_37040 [Hymenobacter qilianensis]
MRVPVLFTFSLLLVTGGLRAQQQPVQKEIAAALAAIKDFEKQSWKRDSSSNQVLRSRTESSFAAKGRFYQKINAQLKAINQKSLSFDDQINLELLSHDVLDELAEYQFKSYLNPIQTDAGFHATLASRGNTIIHSKKDAEQYLILLKDIPRFVDENLQLMRLGIAAGITQPREVLNGYETSYTQHIVETAEQSVFWKPFATKPASISEADWAALQTTAKAVINKDVTSSYRKIKTFFDQEYLPKARPTLGASGFPDGRAYYEDRVRHFTTTNLTSEQVYQLGLKEVARIRGEMDNVIRDVKFKGNFKEFIAFLRTDPQFQPKTADALLKDAAYIAKTVEGKLPSLFGKLPRQPFTVVPVPEYLAPNYTAGRYSRAPISSTRAGEYWVNTSNLPNRTLYTLESLTLHEAVPGHHLQISLTQELTGLPEFRRNSYINAFGEGWGLYSEYLGHEMGFYKDPYSLFGRLTYEMWRACRLVIDVGIHSKGWTREQAVAYLADNTALSLHEVNTEVNRYILWPGQALAYKMGELKIKEMRQKAEVALKDDFDIRAFHDMVLSNGTVTLSILEKMTDRFIQEQQGKIKKKKS